MQQVMPIIQMAIWYLRRILLTLGYPLDVLWKHHMGERHLRPWKAWSHLFLIGGLLTTAFVTSNQDEAKEINIAKKEEMLGHSTNIASMAIEKRNVLIQNAAALAIFQGLVWGCVVLNLFEVRNKKKQGIRWYSRFSGVPRFLPDDQLSNLWLIPGCSFAIGLWLSTIFIGLGTYIMVCAFFQCLAYAMQVRQEYNRFLDGQDAQISREHMLAAIEGASPIKTEGFSAPGWFQAARQSAPQVVTAALTEADLADRFKDVLTKR
jgi:hypothetical protein